jgi:hypothetical protein
VRVQNLSGVLNETLKSSSPIKIEFEFPLQNLSGVLNESLKWMQLSIEIAKL